MPHYKELRSISMFKLMGLQGIRVARARSLSNARRVDADNSTHEADAAGYSAERAPALDRDLPDRETLGAVEAENGEEGGRIWDGGGIEAVENLECDKAGCERVDDWRR
jgi:hypothetical protein